MNQCLFTCPHPAFRCCMVKDTRSSTMRFTGGGGKLFWVLSQSRCKFNYGTLSLFRLVEVPLESNCKQEALGNQVSGAHLILLGNMSQIPGRKWVGKEQRERADSVKGQLGVCLLVLGTAPTPAPTLPETALLPGQGPLISHLLYIFLWSAETTRPIGESTGERWTIKVLKTKEHLAWADFFFKTTEEIWKLVQNGNSGKRDLISLWS